VSSFTSSSRARIATLTLAVAASMLVGAVIEAQPRPASERHAIRLHRAMAVGARARIDVTGEKHQLLERRAGSAWEPQRTEDTTVTLRAIEQVLTVNPEGNVTSSEYTIEAFEVVRGTARLTPLPAGTVLRVVRAAAAGETASWLVRGAPVAPEIVSALSVVISGKVSEAKDDLIFGSTTARRVGERWRPDVAAARADLERSAQIDATFTGEVSLVELTTLETLPCLVVNASLSGRLNGMPSLPGNATFVNGTLDVTHSGAYPTDGTSRPLRSAFTMSLETTFTVRAANAPAQTFRMRVREGRTETVSTAR
jgi:hypothetical protein